MSGTSSINSPTTGGSGGIGENLKTQRKDPSTSQGTGDELTCVFFVIFIIAWSVSVLIFLSLCFVPSSRCLSPVSSAGHQTTLGEHGRQRAERKGSATNGRPGIK